jgi:4-hydroxy-4-methyl-2-oxoglutarate aldolase
MKFPVWAKAVSPQGTVKASPGSVNVPVVCAGMLVNPGDVMIGDADGVVVVPRAMAAAVADAGQQRIVKEVKSRERLANGELGVDFYGLRAKLKELGVEYVDEEISEEIAASVRSNARS